MAVRVRLLPPLRLLVLPPLPLLPLLLVLAVVRLLLLLRPLLALLLESLRALPVALLLLVLAGVALPGAALLPLARRALLASRRVTALHAPVTPTARRACECDAHSASIQSMSGHHM